MHKFKSNLILALIFSILTLGQQLLFFSLKGLPIVHFHFEKYVAIYLFLLFFTFAKSEKIRFFLLSFVLILNYFQMAHMSYFGTQILPAEFILAFTQFHEIAGTLKEELHHLIVPLILTIIPLLLGWKSVKKFKSKYEFNFVTGLFVIYFLYNPIRTYITGNTWGRQPSTRELAGMNVYLSLSYFMGRILPSKIGQISSEKIANSSLDLIANPSEKQEWDKVILVLGESLTPHHMSLFGYQKPTTPFLLNLKKSKNFYSNKALSGGVSSDISVAFLFNMGYGEAGNLKAIKGQHCLFKLAKSQKYSTHFLSIQSSEQLRYIAPYICPPSLDDYRSLEQIAPDTPDHQAAVDRHLLPKLGELLDKNDKQFIVIHQRGSHGPWSLRSTEQSRIFKKGLDDDQRVIDYDNSVVEFDFFWKDLNELLSKRKEKVLVVYVSDHGETLGEEGGIWGHGFLNRRSFEVPVMIQSFNNDLPAITQKLPKVPTHYNVALYLIEQLGLNVNQDVGQTFKDYSVYGNDIDGFAGKMKINFTADDYQTELIP